MRCIFVSTGFFRSPRCLMRRGMPYQVYSEWGWYFLAGVWPDSSSRSDTFLLLRAGARLSRFRRDRSCVVYTFDSRVFSGSSGRAAVLNRDVRARRQAPPQAKLRYSPTAPAGGWIRLRRKRETERRPAGERLIEVTLCDNFGVFRSEPQVRGAFCFWGGGGGEPTGREWQREHVRRSGAIGLRQRGGHGERQHGGRHTETHDRRAHHHESSNRPFC